MCHKRVTAIAAINHVGTATCGDLIVAIVTQDQVVTAVAHDHVVHLVAVDIDIGIAHQEQALNHIALYRIWILSSRWNFQVTELQCQLIVRRTAVGHKDHAFFEHSVVGCAIQGIVSDVDHIAWLSVVHGSVNAGITVCAHNQHCDRVARVFGLKDDFAGPDQLRWAV